MAPKHSANSAGRLFTVFAIVWLCYHNGVAEAYNWAEPTGPRRTSNVVHSDTRWSKRWGSAVALIDNPPATDEVVQTEAEKSRIFLLGGDDHLIKTGGGELHNDVWRTTGANWQVINNKVDKTIWGDPFPRIVSKMTWEPVVADRVPPEDIAYREWLCCIEAAKMPCRTTTCDKVKLDEFRWSPRRHHGAAWIGKTIFVLGGRARSLEDIPEDEAIGSIPWDRGRNREVSMLMSDVWSSTDGATWHLLNPGCYVHQPDQLHKGAGVFHTQKCRRDSDCTDQRLGNAVCHLGRCVCDHWGPRERFGVESYNERIYVAGGVTHVQRQMCGRRSCGFQYRAVLNDVWDSPDGISWTPLTLSAAWPPRGDFGFAAGSGAFWVLLGRGENELLYKNSTLYSDVWRSTDAKTWVLNSTVPFTPRAQALIEYVAGKLVVYGGNDMIPEPPPPPKLSPAEQALVAAANAPTEAAVELPEGVTTVTNEDGTSTEVEFDIVNGDQLRLLEETWTWNLEEPGSTWVLDFDNQTETQYYVRPSSRLWRLPFVVYEDRELLEGHGIESLEQLADADMDTVLAAKEDVADLCQYRANAIKILESCRVLYVPYDGELIKAQGIVEGDSAIEDYEAALNPEPEVIGDDDGATPLEDTTGCGQEEYDGLSWDEEAVDMVCRWSPPAARNAGSVVLNDFVYALGGYRDEDTFADDVWYRDDHPPVTIITTRPAHESSETLLNFTADEPGVLFEYRFIDLEAGEDENPVYRNWTIIVPPLDFLEWLPGSLWRFQVRGLDPAGNRDPYFDPDRNQIDWEYIPALPWGLIIGLTLLFLALAAGIYAEYRRRRKKKMMERYAIKRMRRKFKGIQKAAQGKDVDWRQYYDDSKSGLKGKALASEMAAELEKAAAREGKKGKKKKDKKGKKGKQRGKGKEGKKKNKKKDKKKDKKKGKKDSKKKDAKKKGKKKDSKKKDKKKGKKKKK